MALKTKRTAKAKATRRHSTAVDLWKVEQMRFTAFMPVIPQALDEWWQQAVGEIPEAKSSNLREAKHRFEGGFRAGRFILQADINRVDWVAAVNVNVEHDYSEAPNLGPLDEITGVFSERIERWLAGDPQCVRIALGVVLLLPVEDRTEGYRKLGQLLSDLRVDPEHSADLLYQINKPRVSNAVTDLKINRLQKWSVMQYRTVHLQIAGAVVQPVSAVGSPGFSACRLELDVNSDAERAEPLPVAQLSRLWCELRDMGIEISRFGDVP